MSNARKIANIVVGTEVKLSGVDSDLANTVSAIKSRLDSDDGKLQSLDTLINSRVSSIKSRLDSDDGKLQQLDTLIKSNLSNLADSDLIVSQLTAKITSVISNLDSDTTGIQAVNTEIQTIKNRLDSDDSKIQSLSILSQSALSVSGMKDSDLKVVSDLRNDLDSEILYVRNIALSYTNYIYTATAGQTTFSGTDDNSVTLAYTAGSILVFLNGIKIEAEDFTATDGTSIVLTEAASVNAQLVIVVPKLESNYVAPIVIDWGGMQTFEIAPNPPVTGHVGYSGIQIALSSTGEYAAVTSMDYTSDRPGYTSGTGGGFIIYKNSSSDYSDSTAWDKVASKHSLPVLSGGPTGATFSGNDNNNQRLGERPIWINEDASKVVIPHLPTNASAASQWVMFVLSRTDSDFSDYGSFNPYNILTDKGNGTARMEGFLASEFDVDKNVERIAYHVPKINSSNVFVAGIAIVKRTGTTWALEAQFDTHDAKTGYQTAYTDNSSSPGMGKDGVVMNDDGDKIVCSSVNGSQNQSNKGAIWTFTRSGTTWSMPDNGTIYNPDSSQNAFGKSISLSADGNYLAVICANGATSGSSVNNKIRTYEWNSGTSGWDELGEILMSDASYGSGMPQWFGDEMDEVKINSDGTILTFNARYDDDSDGLQANTGLLRIYKRSGSTWSLVNYKYGADLFSSVSNFNTNHGSNHHILRLAMSDTGATIMASAPYLDTDIANGNGPTYGAIGILHDS